MRDTPFQEVSRRMFDRWLETRADAPADPEAVYQDALGLLSIKMRLSVIMIDGDDPFRWHFKAIRQSGFISRVLDINKIFADSTIGDFKDRAYMEQAVIPRLREVIAAQKPSIELVKTKLFGINVGYDRILLPQKNRNGPRWVVSSSYAQFLVKPAQRLENLEIDDEAIIQLLIEGATAKEIAACLSVSHRTVEHRLEKMKTRFGAKNLVQLTAMLLGNHLVRPSNSGDQKFESMRDGNSLPG